MTFLFFLPAPVLSTPVWIVETMLLDGTADANGTVTTISSNMVGSLGLGISAAAFRYDRKTGSCLIGMGGVGSTGFVGVIGEGSSDDEDLRVIFMGILGVGVTVDFLNFGRAEDAKGLNVDVTVEVVGAVGFLDGAAEVAAVEAFRFWEGLVVGSVLIDGLESVEVGALNNLVQESIRYNAFFFISTNN